jgi:trimeric autotransporter adhesin
VHRETKGFRVPSLGRKARAARRSFGLPPVPRRRAEGGLDPQAPKVARLRASQQLKVAVIVCLVAAAAVGVPLETTAPFVAMSPIHKGTRPAITTTLADAPAGLRAAVDNTLRSGLLTHRERSPGDGHRVLQIVASYRSDSAEFAGAGFELRVGTGSVGRESTMRPVGSSFERTRMGGGGTYRDASVTESFRPVESGIEQSFEVRQRPQGRGDLAIDVPVSGLTATAENATCPPHMHGVFVPPPSLLAGSRGVAAASIPSTGVGTGACVAASSSVDLSDASGQIVAAYSGLTVTDATGATLPATMSTTSRGQVIVIKVTDGDAPYPLTVDPTWSQTAEMADPSQNTDDGFGSSVAISGPTAAVQDPGGPTYIYTFDGSTWTETAELLDSNGDVVPGYSLALSGTTAIVGDRAAGSSAQGAVYVFTGSGATWNEVAELTASNASSYAQFGSSIALSGTTLVVGTPGQSTPSNGAAGAAYVFTGSGGAWVQRAELTASGSTALGVSVAISGTTAVAGSDDEIDGNYLQGAAYVYTGSGSDWSSAVEVTANDGAAYDTFGYSVAVSGSTLAVGAPSHTVGDYFDQGAVYLYDNSGSGWSFETELSAPGDEASDSSFGASLALSGGTLLIGAPSFYPQNPYNPHFMPAQGIAYLFDNTESGWTEEAEITASDGEASFYDSNINEYLDGDSFGFSVALSGASAFVGAPYHTFTSGDTYYQGAAYVFGTGMVGGIPNPRTFTGGSNPAVPGACKCGASAPDPVFLATGDYYLDATDLSISTYGPALSFTRTYDVQLAQSELASNSPGPFGYGWTDNWAESLVFNTPSSGDVTVEQANGSEANFVPPSDGSCPPPDVGPGTSGTYCAFPDVIASLTYDSGTDTYTFVTHPYSTATFNSSGQLTSLVDANGATLTVSYATPAPGSGNCPSSAASCETITAASGRTITLGWSAAADSGVITSAADPMGRTYTYGYTDGELTSVTDPMGRITSYTYDESNSNADLDDDLLTVTKPNAQPGGQDAGDASVNDYNSSGQIASQTDPAGNETTYDYESMDDATGDGTVVVTDPDGNESAYFFEDDILEQMTVGYGGPNPSTTVYLSDLATLLTDEVIDPNGNVTATTYDADGDVTSSSNALGDTSTYSYNSFDEQTCAALPLAADPCSSLSPPAAISPGSTIEPPSSAPPDYVTFTEYDTNGNKVYATTGDYEPGADTSSQSRTTYELYNGNSVSLNGDDDSCATSAPSSELPCATIDANGVVTQLTYDSDGDLVSTSTDAPGTVVSGTGDASSQAGIIDTAAGSPMTSRPATALSQEPEAIATATIGGTQYVYIADNQNNVIWRINLSSGDEKVVAGSFSPNYDGDGGLAMVAQLNNPQGVAVDSSGDLYIADSNNNVVRFVPAYSGTYYGQSMTAGDIYTIAGDGTAGYSGDGGPATGAELNSPSDVAIDSSGDLYIADTYNNVVRFVPAASGTYYGQSMTAGDIYTIAGNGTNAYSGDGGPATSAELDNPWGVTVDSSGDVFISDTLNSRVRFVPAASGTYYGQSMTADDIYTIAGDGTSGYSGDGGPATSAELYGPSGLAVDSSGDLYVADAWNGVVRFVPASSGTYYGQSMSDEDIYTIAGDGTAGYSGDGGAATSAELADPAGVALDSSGDLVIADTDNDRVRIIPATSGTYAGQTMTAGDIYSIAGNGSSAYSGDGGPAADAEFDWPTDVASDASGDLVIADTYNNAIRFVPSTSGTFFGRLMIADDVYTIAGTGSYGYSGDGGAATGAELANPWGVAIDANHDVVIADTGNNVVRFVPAASGTYFGQAMTAGGIYTIAGDGTAGYSGDGGPATSAELNGDYTVAFDEEGNVFIADSNNNVVRFVPAATGTYFGRSMTAGDIYTIAGNGTAGYSGDGNAATSAELDGPNAVSVSEAGLAIADTGNSVVQFVPFTSGTYYGHSMSGDDIYTVAGDGNSGYSGDGGAATSAELSYPRDVSFDTTGDLYIADSQNDVVRFTPASTGTYYGQSMTAGDIYTIAGEGWSGVHYSGDGEPPLDAEFAWINSVTPDGSGGYYIADSAGGNIRHVVAPAVTDVEVETTYGYDTDGEQTSVTSPDGNVSGANAANYTTTTSYNADGEVTSVTAAGGAGATVAPRTTSYGYDADGNEISMTDPGGDTTHYSYNADDEETLVSDPDGNATLTCYDGDGNVTEVVPPIGVAENSLSAASCGVSNLYPLGYENASGVEYSPTSLASDAMLYTFDAQSDKASETTPAPAGQSGSELTTYAYDAGGRLTSVTAPPASDASGAADSVTTYTYDAANELTSVTIASGTSTASTTSYCYDPDGDKTASVPGDGNTSGVASCSTSSPWQTSSAYQTGYSYDSLGELVSKTTPATSAAPDGATTTYTYDPAGNELTVTDPDGDTVTNSYTPRDQVSQTTYSDSTHAETYVYDANGELALMSDASGTSSYAYDPFGELVTATNGAGETVNYGYNADGNETSITYPLGSDATWATSDTVTFGYDAASNLTSVTDFNGNTIGITNNADGLPRQVTLGGSGDTIETSYDASDSPSLIDLDEGSTTLLGFSYSDGPSGAIASETDTPTSSATPADYSYDANSRLTQMTPGSNSALSYGYDASGNLTTLPTGATGTYDDASELTSSTFSGTTTDYAYNADGQRTGATQGSTSLMSATWNGAGDLTSYDNAAADMSSATYDGGGLRSSDTVTPSGGSQTTQNFVWDTMPSVPQLLMDGTNAYIYADGNVPIEQVNLSSGAVSYLVADALGSVRGVVNSSGSLNASTSYDAWGNPETSGGLSSYTPFGFAGGYTDPAGLIYLVNRYYDPQTGQFISVDPAVSLTHVPYSYANGDPTNAKDPTGLTCEDGVGVVEKAIGLVHFPNGEVWKLVQRRYFDENGEEEDCGDELVPVAGPAVEPPYESSPFSSVIGSTSPVLGCFLFVCAEIPTVLGGNSYFPSGNSSVFSKNPFEGFRWGFQTDSFTDISEGGAPVCSGTETLPGDSTLSEL